MKVFQKLKKWLAGLTSVLLLVGVLAPSYTVATVAVDTVTINAKVTNDQTPSLSGTMSNPTDLVSVTVNAVTYAATNNGDGTWSLVDNTIPEAFALAEGAYDVAVSTESGAIDTTVDELTIDLTGPELVEVIPVPEYTNQKNPLYKFSSDEVGTVVYGGSCGEGSLTEVAIGKNYVYYANLADGLYDDCTITATDEAGNDSNILTVSPFTVDTVAPELHSVADYQNLQPAVVPIVPTPNFISDEGVVLTDDNPEADIATTWELLPTEAGDVATYKVIYLATDLAGNPSEPVVLTVHLGADELVEDASWVKLSLNGTGAVIAERGSKYEDAGAHIVLGGSAAHIWTFGNINLDKVGEYKVGYYSENPYISTFTANSTEAQVLPLVTERSVTVKDTLGPDAVTGLKAVAGNGYVQLSWVNPVNDDLAGVHVYRSTTLGEKGTKVAEALSKETSSFDDYTVINGVTYYYTVVSYDESGNNSADSEQVSALPMAPKVAVASEVYYDDGQEELVEEQDVKSDETQNEVKVEDESKVPVIGIIILILLIVLGLYLLYLQNPNWFSWLAFWKRRNKKSNGKK